MLFALKYFLKYPFHHIRTPEARELLGLMAKFGTVPRYQPRTISFQGVTFLVPDCMSFLFQHEEIFVGQSYRFQSSTDSPVILDCGANIGTSCLFFKKLYPKANITAFEADPQIAKILKNNLTSNGIQGVNIVDKAVWVHDQGIEFVTEGSDGASIYGEGEKQRIESVRLKEYLQKYQSIQMLKMDIEGAEVEVFQDCADSIGHIDHIFIEYHSFPNRPQDLDVLLSILTKNGFRYFIRDAQDRPVPFINHAYKANPSMDLQLNIFAVKK